MRTLQHSYRLFCLTTIGRMLLLLIALSFPSSASWAQDWSKRFDKQHPLIIVGDWDKPPYEFLDENGTPTGSNIDIMREVFSRSASIFPGSSDPVSTSWSVTGKNRAPAIRASGHLTAAAFR